MSVSITYTRESVRSSMQTGARPVTVPSLRVPGREGLGFVVEARKWVSLASGSHGFWFSASDMECVTGLTSLLSSGLLTLGQIRNSHNFFRVQSQADVQGSATSARQHTSSDFC